jgi:tetratricopeptide (TPR) repeat protein
MNNNLILGLFFIFAVIAFSACTKEVPKELLNSNQQQQNQMTNKQEMPNDSIHRNLMPSGDQTTDSKTEGDDNLAETLTKEADDADAKFEKSKTDADKKVCVEKQMEAANYLMFQADLPPKKKYRPALKRYRRVLQLDPNNKEAAANKQQIEDIYQSMGMPIPD